MLPVSTHRPLYTWARMCESTLDSSRKTRTPWGYCHTKYMAVLSRLSPDRWGDHVHDLRCQRANAPELTPKHQKQRQTLDPAPSHYPVNSNYNASWTPRTGPSRSIPPQLAPAVRHSSISRALALSLEDSTVEEQFQVDLKRALQESQSQSQSQSNPPQHVAPAATTDVSAGPSSFLSERAQLEKERLARQKRLRGDNDDRNSSRGPTPSTSTADSEDYESDDGGIGRPAAKRQHLATPRQGKASHRQMNGSSKPSTSSSANTNQPLMFWRGEIRQTANMHTDAKKDTKPTFRLSEIIGEVRPVLFLSQPPTRTPSLRTVATRCSVCDYFFILNRLRVRLQDVLSHHAGHHRIPPRRGE